MTPTRPWISRLKPLRWRRVLGEVALVLAVLAAGHFWNTRHVVRGALPAFEGERIDGGRFTSASLAGRPAVVHFWATWCGVCSAEEGNVEALARGGGVVTVASSSGDAEAVRAHMRARGLTFPVVLDPNGALARRFGVGAFPTSVFVDAAGQIRFVEVGYTTTPGLRLRRFLAGL